MEWVVNSHQNVRIMVRSSHWGGAVAELLERSPPVLKVPAVNGYPTLFRAGKVKAMRNRSAAPP